MNKFLEWFRVEGEASVWVVGFQPSGARFGPLSANQETVLRAAVFVPSRFAPAAQRIPTPRR